MANRSQGQGQLMSKHVFYNSYLYFYIDILLVVILRCENSQILNIAEILIRERLEKRKEEAEKKARQREREEKRKLKKMSKKLNKLKEANDERALRIGYKLYHITDSITELQSRKCRYFDFRGSPKLWVQKCSKIKYIKLFIFPAIFLNIFVQECCANKV